MKMLTATIKSKIATTATTMPAMYALLDFTVEVPGVFEVEVADTEPKQSSSSEPSLQLLTESHLRSFSMHRWLFLHVNSRMESQGSVLRYEVKLNSNPRL